MRKPDLCIYHSPCQDGFTAAWAVYRRWPDIEFLPGAYGAPVPDMAGREVLVVDFSYKRSVLERLGETAAFITILDHHKSAKEDLAPFARAALDYSPTCIDEGLAGVGVYNVQALFDMDRSGAGLTWDVLHPDRRRPKLVEHVEDRDLWRFERRYTREVSAELFSRPYEFAVWDEACATLETDEGYLSRVQMGAAIERKHHKDVGELLGLTRRRMRIGGHDVPVANLPYTMASDAANLLADGEPFGACYFDNGDGHRVFSLRSKEGGADVSAIAAAYGGGGHQHAAGFRAAPGWEGER